MTTETVCIIDFNRVMSNVGMPFTPILVALNGSGQIMMFLTWALNIETAQQNVWISIKYLSKIKPKHLGNMNWILLQSQEPSYCETVREFLLKSLGQTMF